MGFTCTFLHGQTYSALDVNKALSRLTAQGVSLFTDTGEPLTDLNMAMSNLVSAGVDLYHADSCKVTLIGISGNTGTYKVQQGTAIMPNGEMITVDSTGHTFDVVLGTEKNVFIYAQSNNAFINTGSGTPPNGIKIATIAADGTVTDSRTFAVTKVAPNSANLLYPIQTPTFQLSQYTDQSVPIYTIDLGGIWAKHVMISKENGRDVVGCCMALEDGVRTRYFKPTLNGESLPQLSFLKRGQYLDIFGGITGTGTVYVGYEIIIC